MVEETGSAEVEALRAEIADLSAKLSAAAAAQTQAAELGLDLLRQRGELEQHIELLQRDYDTARVDLTRAKKMLIQYREHYKIAEDSDLEELSAQEDTQRLEAEYRGRVIALEAEVKSLQDQLSLYRSEAERLAASHTANEARVAQLETERREWRDELKDLRAHEQTLQSENNELEEENVSLQKQVSNLKRAQIEYELMRVEIERLLEESFQLKAAADEANNLRALAERQEQEALAHAQQEREQRLWLKKEYERLHNDQHLSTLNHLIFGIDGLHAPGEGNDTNAESESLKQLESSMIGESPLGGQGQDLFSQMQTGLSDKVAELELEKEELVDRLAAVQKSVLQAVAPLAARLAVESKEDSEPGAHLKALVAAAFQRLDAPGASSGETTAAAELAADQMRTGLRQAILLAGAKNARLNVVHEKMNFLAHTLHQFYSEIAGGDEGDDRRRKVGELMARLRAITDAIAQRDQTTADTSPEANEPIDLEASPQSAQSQPRPTLSRAIVSAGFRRELVARLAATGGKAAKDGIVALVDQLLSDGDLRGRLVDGDDEELERVFDSLQELVRMVRGAAETAVQSKMATEDKDKAELYQDNTKLKSLLAIKREQVTSFRAVLRSNKTSTESAMQCLRDKYEFEKRLKDEAMESLRRELKQFKEDAATFASHRAMFTARCEELQGQLESAQQSVKSTEEEKRTLNQLLRMAIQQKLQLTQRVEQLEMERELATQQQQTPAGQPKRGPGGRPPPLGGVGPGGMAPRYVGGIRGGLEMTRTVRYPQSSASGVAAVGGPPPFDGLGGGGGSKSAR